MCVLLLTGPQLLIKGEKLLVELSGTHTLTCVLMCMMMMLCIGQTRADKRVTVTAMWADPKIMRGHKGVQRFNGIRIIID